MIENQSSQSATAEERDEQAELNEWEAAKAEFRKKYKTLKAADAIRTMDEVEALIVKAERNMKRLTAAYDILRMEVIPSAMEAEDIASPFTVVGVGRVSLTPDLFINTPAANRTGLISWLKRNRLGSLVTSTINGSTLKAMIKDRIRTDKPIPSEWVNITPFTRATITRKGVAAAKK